jgi:hypothetical protein
VLAQSVSTVTINVRGNNNEALVIDNTEYVISNDYATSTNTPIVVSNLQSGQHTLQIKRANEGQSFITILQQEQAMTFKSQLRQTEVYRLKETKWRSGNNNGQNMVRNE